MRRAAYAAWSLSTITTRFAPREAASKPRAPLPAKRSRQVRPVRSCPSQLKSVSRTRSGVGRRSVRAGKWMRRLRHAPPTILTSFALLRGKRASRERCTLLSELCGTLAGRANHDRHHALGADAALKRAADLVGGDALDIAREVIQIGEREPI